MQGLNVNRSNQPLSTATLESCTLSLLAKQGNVEIMEQTIAKGKMFVAYPASDENSFEFFYVLEGEVYSDDLDEMLSKGDSFYYNNLEETTNFKAITDVKILYFINEPIFHQISDEMFALKEIMSEIDIKDKYTKQHCNRVQEYSFSIAKELGLKGNQLECLQFASIFHDLGKLEIPIEILNKSGKLTNEEYEIIQMHSYHGSQIIKKLYFKDLEQIVLQHHERVDGTGYPNGLKGHEIMLEAAIISVADTYDAMTSDRPYRKALPASVAIDELKKYRGTHFREDVVDAFLKTLK